MLISILFILVAILYFGIQLIGMYKERQQWKEEDKIFEGIFKEVE